MIVAIDYSGYILMGNLQAETAESVISSLNRNFRRFGLTESIITDNGPCFRSQQFYNFYQSLEIEHITSSPYYHEGNGRVEKAIQTLKQILWKCSSEVEITTALIAYLDTPISQDLPSLAELFFNRRINSCLGIIINQQHWMTCRNKSCMRDQLISQDQGVKLNTLHISRYDSQKRVLLSENQALLSQRVSTQTRIGLSQLTMIGA